VADVITKPEITPLLAHARACGCRISTGVQMYQAQAAMIADYLIPEQASV
jgi:shikimate dehydrogenase